MRFDNDIRILKNIATYLEDTRKFIHSAQVNSGLPLSKGNVLSAKQRMKKFQLHSLIAVECFGMC